MERRDTVMQANPMREKQTSQTDIAQEWEGRAGGGSSGYSLRRNWRKIAVVGGAVLVVAVVAAVLLTLYVGGRSHSALTVPATFTAQFRMTPTAATAAAVSGAFHKTVHADGSWVISGKAVVSARNQTTEIVVADDGAVYYTVMWKDELVLRQGCLTELEVPQLGQLKAALDSSSPVDAAQTSTDIPAACVASRTWAVTYEGLSMVVCETADGAFQLSAAGYTGAISGIDASASAESPYYPVQNASRTDALVPLSCPPVFASATPTAASRRLAVGPFFPVSRPVAKLQYPYPPGPAARAVFVGRRLMNNLPVVQLNKNAVGFAKCLFVHGAGVAAGASTSTFTSYWGSVDTKAHCNQRIFLHLDTINNAWDSATLTSAFCAAAGSIVSSTAIFGHGSGNLIIAAALATNKCSIDFATSSWFELQPTYNVARLSEFAGYMCSYYPNWNTQQTQLQNDVKFCTGNTVVPGWRSTLTTYAPSVSWNTVASIIKTRVAGAMCGNYAPGLSGSSYFAVVGQTTSPSSSDVAWSTCWDSTYASRFGTVASNPFYNAAVNYLDVTCRNGDGTWGGDRQPCTWYSYATV